MSKCTTITSLALLKSYIDEGKDCLEYLRPFIIECLLKLKHEYISSQEIVDLLLDEFGLVIPAQTIEFILKRIEKSGGIKKGNGLYSVTDKLESPCLSQRKSEAERHKQVIIQGLINFKNSGPLKIETESEANDALCDFLSDFSIPCFKAFLRGTAIPRVDSDNKHIVLVSLYVIEIQKINPEAFNSFVIVLQGHMLANALTAPDLRNAPPLYNKVCFYFDTPLIIRALGLEGEHKEKAVIQLMNSLVDLGGRLAVFDHTNEEIESVIRGAADHVERQDGRGAIVIEARRKKLGKSDLLMTLSDLSSFYLKHHICVVPRPPFNQNFHIDESFFDDILDDEVLYNNDRAKDYDRYSVIGIFTLRQKRRPSCIENSIAVLVSSNSAFAKAAYGYGIKYEEGNSVSAVITDFSLANMVWLKAPQGASQIPSSELLSFAYAALKPSPALLEKFLKHLETLEEKEKISPEAHQMLRYNSFEVQNEVMAMTLGSEDALNFDSVYTIIQNIQNDLRKNEVLEHNITKEKLSQEQNINKKIKDKLYDEAKVKSKLFSVALCIIIGVIVIGGLLCGQYYFNSVYYRLTSIICTIIIIIITFLNLMTGFNIINYTKNIEKKLLTFYLKKISKEYGFSFED